MNRRNLLLGLGTAATLSGAASVTGATFANSVTPAETDFRVIAEANVNVNGVYNSDTGADFVSSGNTTNDGGVNFTQIDSSNTDQLPAAHAQGSTTSDDLTVTLAFKTDDDDSENFNPFLEIDNTGDTNVENLGILFEDSDGNNGFGGDTSANSGAVQTSEVIQAIEFRDSNGDKISTDDVSGGNSPSDQQVAGTVTIDSGTSENVELDITPSELTGSDIASAAGGADPFSGGVDDIDLVDSISIGTDPDTTNA